MADTISYQYAALSALQRAADQDVSTWLPPNFRYWKPQLWQQVTTTNIPFLQGLNREEREIYAELLSVNNSKSESGYILHLLDVWKGTANLKKAVANIRR